MVVERRRVPSGAHPRQIVLRDLEKSLSKLPDFRVIRRDDRVFVVVRPSARGQDRNHRDERDGSAAGGVWPARFRVGLRAFRWPPKRRPSKLDDSGSGCPRAD